MKKDIVRLENLVKEYGGVDATRALDGIDLRIEKGKMTAIIGQSGSGKSTLLNMIGVLDHPSEGRVIVNGVDVAGLNAKQMAEFRNKTIGFVFQFHYLLPEFSVLENVLMPVRLKRGGVETADELKKAKELIELVGLGKVMNKMATKISGGQKQRTAIARALVNRPKLILADEPTGNLDSETTKSIYQLFKRINSDTDSSFVVITHNNELADKFDRVITIQDGKVVADSLGKS